MEEKKKQTAEEMAEEQRANSIMNLIIAKTFARHSKMSEEEYLKEIGFEGSGKTEDEAIRISFLNLLVETTNQLLRAKETFKISSALLKTYLIDENITEKSVEGEE